jgi:hypothetical protein
MVRGNSLAQLTSDIGKALDDAADSLRWCKRHLHERNASDTLRLVQLNLAYLSLALDWQMEGELDKAESALDRVWWQAHRDELDDATPTGH